MTSIVSVSVAVAFAVAVGGTAAFVVLPVWSVAGCIAILVDP